MSAARRYGSHSPPFGLALHPPLLPLPEYLQPEHQPQRPTARRTAPPASLLHLIIGVPANRTLHHITMAAKKAPAKKPAKKAPAKKKIAKKKPAAKKPAKKKGAPFTRHQ